MPTSVSIATHPYPGFIDPKMFIITVEVSGVEKEKEVGTKN